jgi:phage-related minor tail protein
MTDVASLVLEIDSTQAEKGAASLDKLNEAGQRAGSTADVIKKSYDDQAKAIQQATGTTDTYRTVVGGVTQAERQAYEARLQSLAATQKQTAAVTDASDAVLKLLARYDPLGAKLRQLKSDFELLNKAAMEGAVGKGNDAAVDLAYKKLNEEIAQTKELMSQAGAAGAEGFSKIAAAGVAAALSTAQARRELIVLGHEAVQGNFSRIPGSFMVLAERMGSVGHTALLLLGQIGLVAGAIYVLGKAMADGAAESNEMNNAIAMTGNFAGTTQGQMRQLAQSISDTSSLTIATSKKLVTELVGSGRIGAEAIGAVAKLADDYANATGQSVDKITPELIKLFSDPAKGAEELNKSLHALTPAQLEYIAHLERIGETTKAQVYLADQLNERFPKHAEQLGYVGKAWDEVRKLASGAWDAMMGLGRPKTLEEALADARKQAQQIQDAAATSNALRARLGLSPSTVPQQPSQISSADDLREQARWANEIARAQGVSADQLERQQKAYEETRKAQTYQITQLRDQLTLLQSAPDGADKARRIYEVNKQIEDLQRAMGAEARQITQAQIEGELKRQETIIKGREAQNDAALKFNTISNVEHEQTKLVLELERNTVQQTAVIREQSLQGLTKQEREILALRLQQLQLERQNISAAGGIAQEAAARANANIEIKAAIEYAKQWEAEQEKQDETLRNFNTSLTDQVAQIQAEIGALKGGESTYRQYNQQKEVAIELAKLEAKYTKDLIGLDEQHAEALTAVYKAQRDQLPGLIAQRDAARQAADDLKVQQRAIDDGFRTTDRLAKDVFVGIFDRGSNTFKNLAQTLKDTLLRALYDMVARPWVVQIYSAITGQTPSAQAVGGNGAGLLSNVLGGNRTGGIGNIPGGSNLFSGGLENTVGRVGNFFQGTQAPAPVSEAVGMANYPRGIYGSGTGAFDSGLFNAADIGGAFVPSYAGGVVGTGTGAFDAGLFAASDVGLGAAGSTAGAAGSIGGAFSSVAPYAGAILSLVQGDVKGAAIQAATTAIGTAIFPGVGTAIGAVVGALISAFTGKKGGVPSVALGGYTANYGPQGLNSGYGSSYGGNTAGAQATIDDMFRQFSDLTKQLGATFSNVIFGYDSNSGKDSKNPNFALQVYSGDQQYRVGEYLGSFKKLDQETLNLEVSRGLLTAIKGSQLSAVLKEYFDSLAPAAMSQEQIQQAFAFGVALNSISKAIGPDQTRAILHAAGELATSGETLEQTVTRVSGEVIGFDNIATNLGANMKALADSLKQSIDAAAATGVASALDQANQASIKLKDSLIQLLGGLQNAQTLTQNYYANFYTATEKHYNDLMMIAKAIGSLGITTVPHTRAEFRALVEAQDLTTESGRKTYAGLIAISGAFAQLYADTQTASSGISDLVSQLQSVAQETMALIDQQISLSKSAANTARQTAQAYRGIIDQLQKSVADLKQSDLSPLLPQDKLDEARVQLEQLFVKAKGGDQTALQALPDSAKTFLQASREFNASSQAYTSDFARVMEILATAQGTSTDQANQQDYMGALLDFQTAALQAIKDELSKPSPDFAEISKQTEVLQAVKGLIANGNLIGLTGNGLQDAMRNLQAQDSKLNADMLSALINQSSIDSNQFPLMIQGLNRIATLMQQLVDLQGKLTAEQDAAALAEQQAANDAAAKAAADAAAAAAAAAAQAAQVAATVVANPPPPAGPVDSNGAPLDTVNNQYIYVNGQYVPWNGGGPNNTPILSGDQGGDADGLPWVPFDDYYTKLHYGEAVIDAQSMAAFRKYGIPVSAPSSGGGGYDSQKICDEIRKAGDETIKAILYAAESSQRDMRSQTNELKSSLKEVPRDFGNALESSRDSKVLN